MFGYELGENTELRLLEERHAEQLADLTDRNREHLRTWLPWVDASRTVEDSKNAQGIEPYGTPPLIVRRVRAASLAVTAPRLGLPVPGKHKEVSSNEIHQATEGEAR